LEKKSCCRSGTGSGFWVVGLVPIPIPIPIPVLVAKSLRTLLPVLIPVPVPKKLGTSILIPVPKIKLGSSSVFTNQNLQF
jgi:hypothetical protein